MCCPLRRIISGVFCFGYFRCVFPFLGERLAFFFIFGAHHGDLWPSTTRVWCILGSCRRCWFLGYRSNWSIGSIERDHSIISRRVSAAFPDGIRRNWCRNVALQTRFEFPNQIKRNSSSPVSKSNIFRSIFISTASLCLSRLPRRRSIGSNRTQIGSGKFVFSRQVIYPKLIKRNRLSLVSEWQIFQDFNTGKTWALRAPSPACPSPGGRHPATGDRGGYQMGSKWVPENRTWKLS